MHKLALAPVGVSMHLAAALITVAGCGYLARRITQRLDRLDRKGHLAEPIGLDPEAIKAARVLASRLMDPRSDVA